MTILSSEEKFFLSSCHQKFSECVEQNFLKRKVSKWMWQTEKKIVTKNEEEIKIFWEDLRIIRKLKGLK